MNINLSYVFLFALISVLLVFLLLCYLKGRFHSGAICFIGDALRYLCLQGLLSLGFLLLYVFFVKNGFSPSPSDIGVAFIPVTVGVYWAAWAKGVLSPTWERLCLPFAYSLFLLWRFFTVKSGVAFFGYLVFNPSFGFIGNRLFDGKLKPLAAIATFLPFLCAAIGRGLAIKRIDKKRKV